MGKKLIKPGKKIEERERRGGEGRIRREGDIAGRERTLQD